VLLAAPLLAVVYAYRMRVRQPQPLSRGQNHP
jgi:hypothetical protein